MVMMMASSPSLTLFSALDPPICALTMMAPKFWRETTPAPCYTQTKFKFERAPILKLPLAPPNSRLAANRSSSRLSSLEFQDNDCSWLLPVLQHGSRGGSHYHAWSSSITRICTRNIDNRERMWEWKLGFLGQLKIFRNS